MLEHSAKKVELLRHYLTAYLAVLGSDPYTPAIACHDLFCGEGVYPNGGKGSPIVFSECLKESASRNPGKSFSLHFNDCDPAKVANVGNAIAGLGALPSNFVTTASNQHFDDVIQSTKVALGKMGRSKAFLFIDPYGYKEIKPQLVRELVQCGRSEVLLFLPTQQMFRFSKKGTPEALSDFLEGIRQGREFPSGATISAYIAYIVEGFRRLMPDTFVDSFTIQKDPQTAFCLFFFTSNHKGAEKMLEAKWKLDEQQGRGWSFTDSGYEGSLFAEPHINPLERILEKMLKKAPQSNAAIYDMTIRSGFLPKHANQVLSAMQKHGRLKIPDGIRQGAFYINYAATFGGDPAKLKNITFTFN